MSGILDPPARPLDISRFTSNELFGQPGIYPDGPTMAPASGEPLREAQAAALLERWGGRSLEVYRSAEVAAVTEVPQMRAAISLLVGSPAEPLMEALLAGGSHIHELGVGALAQPGRVVGGPAADARAGVRWLNERYAAEHPAVVAPRSPTRSATTTRHIPAAGQPRLRATPKRRRSMASSPQSMRGWWEVLLSGPTSEPSCRVDRLRSPSRC